MKKDIYIIKNDLNDKVYVGQAKNTEERFKQHCKLNKRSIFLDREINRLGKEHFWYEVLETQIENYNEKERYWIKYYNSYKNGYNQSEGGELCFDNPKGVDSQYSKIKDKNVLNSICQDLVERELTMIEIGRKYNTSVATISNVNQGITYYNEKLNYPLRPSKKGSQFYFSHQEQEEIKRLIKEELIGFQEIAEKYNITLWTIYHINAGVMWHNKQEDYPLRKFHYSEKNCLRLKQVKQIHEDLVNTKMSLRSIAEKSKTSIGTVQAIKNGARKCYLLDGYIYPLRPNNFKKPVSTISAKESTTTIDT